MKKKLLNAKKFSKQCENCRHGRLAPDEDCVLCEKKGVMHLTSVCRKFEYDPLRRRPKRPVQREEHDPSEFVL